MDAIAKEMREIEGMLRLLAQAQSSLITGPVTLGAAEGRRQDIRRLRKRFHLLTKRLDDIDRRRIATWKAKAKRAPLKRRKLVELPVSTQRAMATERWPKRRSRAKEAV